MSEAPTAEELKRLADRQNDAITTIRLNGGGYIAYISAIHVVEPFGGDYAIKLHMITGGEARKQLQDFVAEVEGWECTAAMMEKRTPEQKEAARLAGIASLPPHKVFVMVY